MFLKIIEIQPRMVHLHNMQILAQVDRQKHNLYSQNNPFMKNMRKKIYSKQWQPRLCSPDISKNTPFIVDI